MISLNCAQFMLRFPLRKKNWFLSFTIREILQNLRVTISIFVSKIDLFDQEVNNKI